MSSPGDSQLPALAPWPPSIGRHTVPCDGCVQTHAPPREEETYPPHLRRLARRLVAASRRAGAALRRLAVLAAREELLAARQAHDRVERRHANDGAQDRRHQSLWLTLAVWPAIAAAAAFDTLFFADVFQQLIDIDGSSPEAWLAYLPGPLLGLALVLTGVTAAKPVLAWQHRAEGYPPSDLRRAVWGPAVLLGLLVVFTFAWWGRIRARDSDDFDWLGVVLVVMVLTLTAIGLKVAAYNPFASSAREARRRLRWVEWRYHLLARRVERVLAAQERAWYDLAVAFERVPRPPSANGAKPGFAALLEEHEPEDLRDEWDLLKDRLNRQLSGSCG